jgi:ribosomal-protein-alanine N-acetyltransferase
MTITVRTAGPVLAPVLGALHTACLGEPWDAEALATLMAMPGIAAFVATAEGENPAGFVLVRSAADEAEILAIGVVPEERRRGVGKALLAAALATLRQAGAANVFLEVAEDNAAARAFYVAAGFEPVGLRRGYYRRPGGSADALVLRCGLHEKSAA